MYLSIRDVSALAGLSRSSIYKMMSDLGFPRPVKLRPGKFGCVRWRKADVIAWVESRAEAVAS